MNGGDKIEQSVILKDQATTGDIKMIGKVVNIILHPAQWQDTLFTFVTQHWNFMLPWAALQSLLAWGWFSFQSLYRISWILWALAAILLTGAAWGGYTLGWQRPTRTGIVFSLMMTGGLLGIVGWHGYQILFPATFPPGAYGVVFADLGEGGDYRPTRKAKELSDLSYENLCSTIQEEFSKNAAEHPCWDNTIQPTSGRVQLQRVGVINSSQMARDYGLKVKAKVVIWGNLLISDQGRASVRFQMLETPDRQGNPDFPIIIPLTIPATDLFTNELDLESDAVKLKLAVAQQSTLITSATLGIASFASMDYLHAVQYFGEATNQMSSSNLLRTSPQGKSLLYFYSGRANLYMGNIRKGIEQLKTAQDASPAEPAIYLSLALAYNTLAMPEEKAENQKKAWQTLQDWLVTHPDDNNGIFDRGILRLLGKEYLEAILDFEQVIERNPDFFTAYVCLGEAAFHAEQPEKAEKALKQAIEIELKLGANPYVAELNLGMVEAEYGKVPEAHKAFQAAVDHVPNNYWPYFYIAKFYEEQGEMDSALLSYQKVAEMAWNKGWAYGKLGEFYQKRGLLIRAIDSYLRAINQAPGDSLLRTSLAVTYLEAGETKKAMGMFQSAVELNEPIPYVYGRFAQALFDQGDYIKAAQMYERARSLHLLDESLLLNLGQTYQVLGRAKEAKEVYLEIINMDGHLSPQAIEIARQRLAKIGVTAP